MAPHLFKHEAIKTKSKSGNDNAKQKWFLKDLGGRLWRSRTAHPPSLSGIFL
jgi:hypothetical protein